jgi:hypothetical protein
MNVNLRGEGGGGGDSYVRGFGGKVLTDFVPLPIIHPFPRLASLAAPLLT